MFKVNPYRPGAGLMPVYIAGRDEDIQNVSQMFDALTMDIPTQSIIFSGLRGVGKTVLINKLQSIAEEKGIFCKHIEIEERNDFISQTVYEYDPKGNVISETDKGENKKESGASHVRQYRSNRNLR